nr:hypothetical protein [Ezakiella coagulans]
MRKRLSILLVLATIFSLVACGKKPADDKADKASEKVENKADTEKKEEKKEEAKAKGMIEVHGEGIFTTPEGIEELSEERLKEIYEYFDKNMEETQGMTYEEVEEYIGVPGAHFVDHDEENENGELTKSIFWYSPDHFLSMVFTADKDSPDDFGFTETWAMPKAIDEDEVDPQSESEEKPTVAYSDETGMLEVTGGSQNIYPGDISKLSEEELEKIAKYFKDNYYETQGMTYEEVAEYIGVPGAHFEDYDEVDPKSGELTRYVCWYSENSVFVAFFNADAEHPDNFGLVLTEYHEQFK